MKILMFGRGTIATIYGWALERAGHDVEFYVRPGRAAAYGATTRLDLLDTRRRMLGRPVTEDWPVHYRESLAPDHDFELIILSVAHSSLPEAVDFLAPRLGGATVLMFSNLWTEPLDAIGSLPVDRVAWGFPQAGGGLGDDGVLRGALLPSVIFGTLGLPPTDRERAARQAFRTAGFRIQERADFRGWLWIHFATNVGFHSQAVQLGSFSKLIGATDSLRSVLLTSREFLPVVEVWGVDLRRHRSETALLRAPTWLTAPLLAWLVTHFPPLRANFAAQSGTAGGEPGAILRDALAEARRLGVPTPRLEAAEPYFARADGA